MGTFMSKCDSSALNYGKSKELTPEELKKLESMKKDKSPLKQSYEEAMASAKERDLKDPKYLAEIAEKRRKSDLKKGLIDPKTGKRKKEHTFDYSSIRGKDPNVIIDRKTGDIKVKKSKGFGFLPAGNIKESKIAARQVPENYEGYLNFKK